MKKSQIIKVIITVIVFVITSSILYFGVIKKHQDIKTEKTEEKENIVKYHKFAMDANIIENYYYTLNNNELSVYDWNNELILTHKVKKVINNVIAFAKKYFIISDYGKNYLYDIEGKLINTGDIYDANDYETNKEYIVINNEIYNNNLEKIYSLKKNIEVYDVEILNNLIFINTENKKSYIYDLTKKEVLKDNFDCYYIENNYVIIPNSDKEDNVSYTVIDYLKNKNLGTYISEDFYKFSNSHDTFYIDSDNELSAYELEKTNKYNYKKDNQTCVSGYKLLDSNNEVIINECNDFYYVISKNIIVASNDENDSIYINNKEEYKGHFEYQMLENYFLLFDNNEEAEVYNTYIYNLNGDKIKSFDSGIDLEYVGKDIYAFNNFKEGKGYFVDKDLNKIGEEFISLSCHKIWCVAEKSNGLYNLYKYNNLYLDDDFIDISLNDKYIAAKTLFENYVFELGNNDKIDIKIDDPSKNIDINEIIKEYKLEDSKDIINQNKDFFKKYAYIVKNNKNLLTYQKQVMDMFKVVIDNKKYLDELYFLKNLKKLNFEEVEEIKNYSDGTAGLYIDYQKRITLKNKENEIVYHELMHFVDHNIGLESLQICKNQDNYIVSDNNQNCEYVSYNNSSLFTEGGAELFKAKYFDKRIESYYFATITLTALEYIYDEETIKEWFFNPNGDLLFFKKMLDLGYSQDEVLEINNKLTSITEIGAENNAKLYVAEYLIKIYQKEKNENWQTDNKFLYLIYCLVRYELDNFKYREFLNKDFTIDIYDWLEKTVIGSDNNKRGYNGSYGSSPIILDGKYYLTAYISREYFDGKNNIFKVVLIDYDFDNNKILNYEFVN